MEEKEDKKETAEKAEETPVPNKHSDRRYMPKADIDMLVLDRYEHDDN